jgi:hypothetical protein
MSTRGQICAKKQKSRFTTFFRALGRGSLVTRFRSSCRFGAGEASCVEGERNVFLNQRQKYNVAFQNSLHTFSLTSSRRATGSLSIAKGLCSNIS